MKIAINATILDNKPSGLGVHTHNIIKEMSILIGTQDRLIVFTSCPEAFERYNVKIRKVSKWVQPKYGKKAGFFRFIWTQIVYPIRLLKEDFDIIYNTTHHAAYFTNRPQVITIHDLLSFKFTKRHKLQYYYFKLIIPIFLKRCSAVVTVSESSKKDILAYYKIPESRVFIVYNSYDKDIFKPLIRKEMNTPNITDDYILIVGASYQDKNIERVLKAYASIKDRISQKIVIVGGRKEYMNVLKKKAAGLKTDNQITFIDYISLDMLPHIYARAKVFLSLSLCEGFGMPLLEAMACGCPVIASDIATSREVCGDAAYYVDPYSVDAIAEGIHNLMTDQKLRDSLIEKGLKRVKLFSWERSAKSILDICRDLA